MEENVCHVELVDRSVTGESEAKDNVDGGRLDDGLGQTYHRSRCRVVKVT
jgi:hypothetical protein